MSELSSRARNLYSAFSELVRRYQFRDRDQICCYGLSVSQCYALEGIAAGHSKTMGELAARLCLKISSVTRVVDHLVEHGLAKRVDDPQDRRVCRIRITSRGQALIDKIQNEIIGEYERVLRSLPPQSRDAVVQAVDQLLAAYEHRTCACHEQQAAVVPLTAQTGIPPSR